MLRTGISGSLCRRLPAGKQEGLFGVDQDAYAVAKLYIFHDSLEGVQFRDQSEIEAAEKMPIVLRKLADVFYEPFADDLEQGAH